MTRMMASQAEVFLLESAPVTHETVTVEHLDAARMLIEDRDDRMYLVAAAEQVESELPRMCGEMFVAADLVNREIVRLLRAKLKETESARQDLLEGAF